MEAASAAVACSRITSPFTFLMFSSAKRLLFCHWGARSPRARRVGGSHLHDAHGDLGRRLGQQAHERVRVFHGIFLEEVEEEFVHVDDASDLARGGVESKSCASWSAPSVPSFVFIFGAAFSVWSMTIQHAMYVNIDSIIIAAFFSGVVPPNAPGGTLILSSQSNSATSRSEDDLRRWRSRGSRGVFGGPRAGRGERRGETEARARRCGAVLEWTRAAVEGMDPRPTVAVASIEAVIGAVVTGTTTTKRRSKIVKQTDRKLAFRDPLEQHEQWYFSLQICIKS